MKLIPVRRASRIALLIFTWAGWPCACHAHASREDCQEMTDHYLDLAVKETPGAAAMSSAQSAAVRDVERGLKRAEPSYRTVQDHCDGVTGAEVSCAKGAPSTKAWEACVHRPDAQ
jgi:hypothetical protein